MQNLKILNLNFASFILKEKMVSKMHFLKSYILYLFNKIIAIIKPLHRRFNCERTMKEESEILARKIEDRIVQLIFVAEANFECCKAILNFLNIKENLVKSLLLSQDESRYLVLSAHNHFCESVGIIHTLLHRIDKKNRELSFQLYQDKVLSEGCYNNKTKKFITNIKNLWKEFEKGKFPEIRNKICSHKEFKNVGEPVTLAVHPLDSQWIEKLDQVIKDLKRDVFKFFKDSTSNNPLDNSKWGLKNILNRIREKHE